MFENILNKDKDQLSVDKLRAFGFRRGSMQFDNIDSALMALKNGETIIVVDDENRENEGDLVAVTEWMNNNP